MSKISSSLRNLRDRIRASVSVKTRNVLFFLALFLIIILAIVIRITPIIEGNLLIKAFDPWIQYYNADYLSTHSLFEYFHWHDFKSWFPEGYARGDLRPGLTFTVVVIYYIINSFGIPVSLYNICFFFPAFMGGASVYAAYLLGKEALDRKCGLFAAFFLALNTGFMQRTTAGFFDNETIGVFATLMCFYFFLKTVRTGKFVHAVLGGVFLGYLSLSWGGYNFVYLILPIVCGILILTKKYNSNVLLAYAGIEGIGLIVFGLYKNFHFENFFSSLEIIGVFLFTMILILFHLIYTKKSDFPRFYNGLINFIKWGFIPTIIIVAVIIWVAPDIIPFGLSKRLESVMSPLVRDTLNIVASVAEHMPSSWSTFYYNTLVPLMLLPLGLFFLFKRANVPEILLITFLILIFYFTGSMIRIILLFAPAACLVGAYGLVNVLKIFGSFFEEKRTNISRKRKRQLKRTVGRSEIGAVYLIVGIMCFAQIVQASDIAVTQLSQSQIAPGGDIHDWEESLTWMKTNLPGNTVVVSWWDYGYWLTPIGNMTTVNDNATINQTRIGLTGMAMMQTNELYSAKAFKKLYADYVLVYFGGLYSPLGGDEGKWPWMLRICNDNYNFYKRLGMEEDNWAPNSVFLESDYWNDEQQAPENNWFESTLVKLMFYGIPTAQITESPTNFMEYYQQQIYARQDANGNTYASHIPEDGLYDFIVFRPAYISRFGLVKLFKLDYTALESDFEIQDPAVYNSGFGTLKINNLGSKDLEITQVLVNGKSYDFKMGKGINTNVLPKDESDLIWLDIKSSGDSYEVNDVVNITVTAQSIALDDKIFTFNRSTDSFFVQQAPTGKIRINKANSNVVQIDDTTADMYLEVENIGNHDVILDKFYIDTEDNELNDAEYLSGSPILEPGQSASIKLTGITNTFHLDGTFHKIGILTPNNIRDEILMCSNNEGYEITILDDDRIVSPEISAFTQSDFRKQIPINLGDTSAYKHDNGTVTLQIRIKNTGDIILGVDSINITKTTSWEPVDIPEPFNLDPGHEKVFNIIASDYLTGIEVNDEIGVIVTANFDGPTIASDIGYVHVLKDQPDLQIIDTIEGATASYIAANETGQLLIKNTGITPLELDSLYINETTMLSFDTDMTFESGDKILDIQEAALVSFNIPGLKINQTNLIKVNITTNTTASTSMDFYSIVNSTLFDISIDDTLTTAHNDGDLEITIKNVGSLNVTVDGVYINGTYVDISNFEESVYEIGIGESLKLTLPDFESFIGTVNQNEYLEILVITKEGAEDIHLIQVLPF